MGQIKNCHVIVTGGAGFIGSHLVGELVNLHNRVTVIDLHCEAHSLFARNKLENKTNLKLIDIRDKKKILALFKTLQPQYVFHLAAQAIVDDAYTGPFETLETNIMGTINVLEAARHCRNLQCVLVTSSDKAYGKKQGKYNESDALRGDHPYEVSKSAADLISHSYFQTYGLPVIVTRFGNVYGEGDLNFSRIIPSIMTALVQRKTLLVRSDGTFVRDYLYVKDVVLGSLKLAQYVHKAAGEAFNFGSHETLSVIELIKVIQRIVGIKIPYKILNIAKNEIPSQSLNYSKISRLISWKPTRTLKQTIPDIFEFYKKYYEVSGLQ